MRLHVEGDGFSVANQDDDSQALWHIVNIHLPKFLALFSKKNKEYGSVGGTDLGIRGQYADIHRKLPKLKKVLWDGGDLQFEQIDEVIMDLIGHLFLTLDMLRKVEATNRENAYSWPADDDEFMLRTIMDFGGPERALTHAFDFDKDFSDKLLKTCVAMLKEQGRKIHSDMVSKLDDGYVKEQLRLDAYLEKQKKKLDQAIVDADQAEGFTESSDTEENENWGDACAPPQDTSSVWETRPIEFRLNTRDYNYYDENGYKKSPAEIEELRARQRALQKEITAIDHVVATWSYGLNKSNSDGEKSAPPKPDPEVEEVDGRLVGQMVEGKVQFRFVPAPRESE